MIDFDALVLKPAGDIFQIAVVFTPAASQPGVPPFYANGVYSSDPIDVTLQNETIYSDQQTKLCIRLRDFSVYPTEGDFVTITDVRHPAYGKQFWVGDLDEDGQGGGALLLRLKVGRTGFSCFLAAGVYVHSTGVHTDFSCSLAAGVYAHSGAGVRAGFSCFLAVGVYAYSGAVSTGNSAYVQQFFDRLLTLPTTQRRVYYTELIDGLVSDGVWGSLDVLLTAAADPDTSLTNIVQLAFKASLDTLAGPPVFTSDLGWSHSGAVGQTGVDTNFNPSTAGGEFTQNDAMFCVWIIGNIQENFAPINTVLGNSNIELYPLWSNGITYYSVNTNGIEDGPILGLGTQGFWLVQRTTANLGDINKDGNQVSTSSTVSHTLTNSNIFSSTVLNNTAVIGIGKSLSSLQKTALYNRLHTFLTSIGAI